MTVSTPSISSSSVSNGTKVTISGSSGATIFYTTNGSNPTESSNKYNGAFVLSNSATVKAIAMQNCRFNSSVASKSVTVTKHTVTFKDWNGSVLKTQSVFHGGAATAPANPTRTGYTFTGWDKAFNNVTADLVVTAQYSANTYTVTFKDWNGTVLKTQQVQYGGAATAPADPTRTGYTFTGWDKAFTNVTADLVVTAQYEMLGDVDDDGNVSMADALTILRMAMDILPVENQQIADVDGDGFITSMDALLALRFAMHIEQ